MIHYSHNFLSVTNALLKISLVIQQIWFSDTNRLFFSVILTGLRLYHSISNIYAD